MRRPGAPALHGGRRQPAGKVQSARSARPTGVAAEFVTSVTISGQPVGRPQRRTGAAGAAVAAGSFQLYSTKRRMMRQPGGESMSDTDEVGSFGSV